MVRFVVDGAKAWPQTPAALQVRVWHSSFGGSAVQPLGTRHSTHTLELLHKPAALGPQELPYAFGGFDGSPAEHRSSVQSLPSTGTSRSSFCVYDPVCPSQNTRWQSPSTCKLGGTAMPAGTA